VGPRKLQGATVKGDERRVVEAFCAHLHATGWQVSTEMKYADVVATRDGQTLYAEAKGRTTSAGLESERCIAGGRRGRAVLRLGGDLQRLAPRAGARAR